MLALAGQTVESQAGQVQVVVVDIPEFITMDG
jgi:hypothetical protein